MASDAIPAIEPAPVAIDAADLKPAPAIDIPLPDAAPVTALMQADVVRMAVEGLFADDAAMREMRVSGKDREALSAYYAKAERPLIWARDGAWSPAASGAMERLRAADEDGLDPADYALPDRGLRKDAPPAQWAEGRREALPCRDPLCPRRPRRAHRSCPPFGARDPEAVAAGGRRGAEQGLRRRRCGRSARILQPAACRLQGPEGAPGAAARKPSLAAERAPAQGPDPARGHEGPARAADPRALQSREGFGQPDDLRRARGLGGRRLPEGEGPAATRAS